MIKKLIKDSAIYTGATVLTKGVQLFLLPVLSRLLTPEQYGINDIIFILSLYAVSLLTVELNQAIARFYPAEKNLVDKVIISSTGLFFVLATFSVFLVVELLLSASISIALFGSELYAPLLRTAGVALVCNGVFSYLQAQLRWDLRSFDYSVASIAFVIVSTTVSIFSIAILNAGGAGVFMGQIAGAVCAGFLSFIRNREAYRLVFSWARLKAMLRFSGPLLISTWLVLTSLYIDRFFIQARFNVSSVGIYSMASKFSSIVSILFVGFNMAITPLIYASAESEDLPADISSMFSLFLPLAGLLSCFTFIFSREIIFMLTSTAYHSGRRVMPMLVFSTIMANLYLFTPGLSIKKNTKPIVFISLVSMVLSVSMNAVLVPRLGMAGSALASVVTSSCVFMLNFIFSQHYYYIPFNKKAMAMTVAMIGVSAFSTLGLDFSAIPYQQVLVIKILLMVLILAFVYAFFPQIRKAGRVVVDFIKTQNERSPGLKN